MDSQRNHLCVLDNFLENSVFESFVAFFRFQHLFLEPNKNYWNRLNNSFYRNVYVNQNLRKASSPASCCSILENKVTDPSFLTNILRDEFYMTNYEIDSSDITRVDVKAWMLSNGSAIKKHVDYPFEHKENEMVIKIMYYAHSDWDTSNWYGELEFWRDNIITHQYDPRPNRLIVFPSNHKSFHSISPIETIPINVFQNVVVFYVKVALRNEGGIC